MSALCRFSFDIHTLRFFLPPLLCFCTDVNHLLLAINQQTNQITCVDMPHCKWGDLIQVLPENQLNYESFLFFDSVFIFVLLFSLHQQFETI